MPGALLTREEVVALIGEHDLDEHRDAILAAVRPGYRLQPDRDGPHRIGGSLAVVILHEDLAEARYDRLWTDTSTG